MKKILLLILLTTCSIRLTSNATVFTVNNTVKINKILEYNLFQNQLETFLTHLAFKESTNNPDTFNTIGYIGKYQFGKAALKDVKINIDIKEFQTNSSIFPEALQDTAIIRLLRINKKRLTATIETYNNTKINGINITESGILAAAHLAGAYGVKQYFENGTNFKDKYGTSIEKYLKEFSQFKLNINLL